MAYPLLLFIPSSPSDFTQTVTSDVSTLSLEMSMDTTMGKGVTAVLTGYEAPVAAGDATKTYILPGT